MEIHVVRTAIYVELCDKEMFKYCTYFLDKIQMTLEIFQLCQSENKFLKHLDKKGVKSLLMMLPQKINKDHQDETSDIIVNC